ncbi:MAG: diaminopimelate decarboxylase [Planctomycetota bacterium]
MDHFTYRDGRLMCERVPADELADRFGTPLYVYSASTFRDHYTSVRDAFGELDPLVCYSIKSCGNVHLLRLLAELGSGMDVVSGGELHRAMQAGVDPAKIVYAGVGKTDPEIAAAIEAGIGWFNIESEAEFENIASIAARMGRPAHAALRINPDVADEKTHDKTTTGKKETKFGVDIDRAMAFFQKYATSTDLLLHAIHLHIGSPIYSPEPYVKAITKTLELVDQLREAGFPIRALDIGGGYAADYETGASPAYQDYADAIVPLLQPFKDAGGTVILEPGRTLAANAGILLTRVQYLKKGGRKKFVIVDTGMHHLIRPTLYDAWQFIWPASVAPNHIPPGRARDMDMPGLEPVDIVGPICETGDYLALDRPLPPVARGDLLAVFSAGAYGMVMASNYNTMPKPPEVLVDGDDFTVIRRRETYDDLLAAELEPEAAAVVA